MRVVDPPARTVELPPKGRARKAGDRRDVVIAVTRRSGPPGASAQFTVQRTKITEVDLEVAGNIVWQQQVTYATIPGFSNPLAGATFLVETRGDGSFHATDADARSVTDTQRAALEADRTELGYAVPLELTLRMRPWKRGERHELDASELVALSRSNYLLDRSELTRLAIVLRDVTDDEAVFDLDASFRDGSGEPARRFTGAVHVDVRTRALAELILERTEPGATPADIVKVTWTWTPR